MCELKNLQASGLTTLGHALRTAFDLLNLNRLVSGIDNYGQGRNPFFLEPSVIITITDGNKLTHSSGVPDELHLPLNSPLAGSELTKEPFRWDQRLFALVLRLPGASTPDTEQLGSVPTDESAITQMCEVTGGRSYCVRTQRMLNQCLESLVQKVQSGVVLNFEKTGPDPPLIGEENSAEPTRPVSSFSPQPWHSCHKLIYVRPNPKTGVPVGHWPIPESFWPDQNSPNLPPRSAHPVVRFSCVDCEPMVIDKLPFDKYELEPSPLTQFILERKSPHMCWQVFVCSSGKPCEMGQPFGYLKASTTLTCVNLFVMPFNYPVLLPLLDDLFKVHKLKPNLKWRQAFEMYLKTMPPYFLMPLKKALRMMGAPNLIADTMDCGLSYSVISYLKKLSQQAKMESDRLIVSVGKKAPQETGIKVKNHSSTTLSLAHRRDFKQLLQGITGEGPLRLADMNFKEFAGFQIALLNKDLKPQAYRNAYDIPRRNLLDQLTRMRSNLLRTSQKLIRGQDEDYLHSIPVAQMGNYQEYLKMMPSPLREIDPDQPKRLHTFGNPFKQDKKGMMIDEADEFVAGPQNKKRGNSNDSNSSTTMKRRRSMSPLLRRPQTPPLNNNHLPGGKSPAAVQGQQNLIKPIPQHKGEDGNNMVVAESNGDAEPESGGIWPAELEAVAESPSSPLSLEEKTGPGAADETEDVDMTEDRLAEDRLAGDRLAGDRLAGDRLAGDRLAEDRLAEDRLEEDSLDEEVERHNCDRLSPQSQMEDPEADPASLEPIFISPLDGSQAELKSQIIKEVRKPGRNYDSILGLLQQVKGPVNVQKYFIQHAIREAVRFKKRVLIQQLETSLSELGEKHASPSELPNDNGSS
ncbi:integrator complex subunit 6 isoform X2 [Eleginops maclovinus]